MMSKDEQSIINDECRIDEMMDDTTLIHHRLNRVRLKLQKALLSKWTDAFFAFIVLCNCVVLAVYDPTVGENEGRNSIVNSYVIVNSDFFFVCVCVVVSYSPQLGLSYFFFFSTFFFFQKKNNVVVFMSFRVA
jgi:hypothetical protein